MQESHTHARTPVLGLPLKSPMRMNLNRNTSSEVDTAHMVTPTVPSAMPRRFGRLPSGQTDATDFIPSNDAIEAKMRRIHDPPVHKASKRLTMTESLKVVAGNETERNGEGGQPRSGREATTASKREGEGGGMARIVEE